VTKIEVKPEPIAVEIKTNIKLVELKPKVEEKLPVKEEPKIEKKSKVPETKPEERKLNESLVIENANYLESVLEINFTKCYKFAAKHPFLNKE